MAIALSSEPHILKQRSDYTHRHNSLLGRHGWLRLTPAYSVKVVEELIAKIPQRSVILDPFCGTATTALVAASHGHRGITTEINPFLVWYAKAKLDHYTSSDVAAANQIMKLSIADLLGDLSPLPEAPGLHNIERWWGPKELAFLLRLKRALDTRSFDARTQARNLVLIGFCRTLIFLSNAAFNHQSMSFKDAPPSLPFSDRLDVFINVALEELGKVTFSATDNPVGTSDVILGDAREVSRTITERIDRIITSPPYPNRMSYIRELRPYMYWLGFLRESPEAAELDWQAIGGTWGSATSRLKSWIPENDNYKSEALAAALEQICSERNANGVLLSNYILRYFHDIDRHVSGLKFILRPGARVDYIVGNSTFYGVLLSVERLYLEIFEFNGFEEVEIKMLRKRNSKKELIEFVVSATWPAYA